MTISTAVHVQHLPTKARYDTTYPWPPTTTTRYPTTTTTTYPWDTTTTTPRYSTTTRYPTTTYPWPPTTTTRYPTTTTTTYSWDTTTTTPRYPTTTPTTRYPTTSTTTYPWDTTTTTFRPSPSTTSASSTSGPSCPLGWVDDGNLGCFLFAHQMAGLSWIEALEYCEEQVSLHLVYSSFHLEENINREFLFQNFSKLSHKKIDCTLRMASWLSQRLRSS